jgi:hypothetical protein
MSTWCEEGGAARVSSLGIAADSSCARFEHKSLCILCLACRSPEHVEGAKAAGLCERQVFFVFSYFRAFVIDSSGHWLFRLDLAVGI